MTISSQNIGVLLELNSDNNNRSGPSSDTEGMVLDGTKLSIYAHIQVSIAFHKHHHKNEECSMDQMPDQQLFHNSMYIGLVYSFRHTMFDILGNSN